MRPSNRMLKRPASFVLASFRPSTYPTRRTSCLGSLGRAGEKGYASVLHSLRPCWTVLLSILGVIVPLSQKCMPSKFRHVQIVFPQPAIPVFMRLAALVLVVLAIVPAVHAADRDKLLSEPGVYGTFAAFSLDADWGKQNPPARIALLTTLRGVVEQYREKLAIDVYLLRGLSDHADVLFRIHAIELRETQQFLLDLQSSLFGKHLDGAGVMHGVTKKANYVASMPDSLKAELKIPSDPGPKPYVIVIPIRKDADWWSLSQEHRETMMQEHTEAAVPYSKTVTRKLYHATGLGDLDFITYFETSRLEDFQSLILALEKVKEFRHNRRFGHPTLLGTVRSLDEIIEVLAQ